MANKPTTDKDEALLEELTQGLKIDKHDLDTDIMEHPGLLLKVSEQATLMGSRRDAAKKDLANLMAEVSQEVRDDLEKEYEDAKKAPTETMVKHRVMLDKEVRASDRECARLDLLASRWSNLRAAFEQRGHALRELVKLYTESSYGESLGIVSREARDRRAEEVRRRRSAGD